MIGHDDNPELVPILPCMVVLWLTSWLLVLGGVTLMWAFWS